MSIEIDYDALTVAHVAIEDVLIELRDARISVMGPANGWVVREKDGEMSGVMRIGTRDGLAIAIKAYLEAVDSGDPAERVAELSRRADS